MRYTRLPAESAVAVDEREALRVAEIELLQHRERVAAQRRALSEPTEVEDYTFIEGPSDLAAGDEPTGEVRLSELISGEGRPVVIYHFMYGKAQTDPCPLCTMWLDGFNGIARHLAHNMDFAVAAAADPGSLRAYARDQGWHNLRLLSCGDNTFKYDLGSEDADGNQDSTISVFVRGDDGQLLHTYTTKAQITEDNYQRGIDLLTPVWNLLDLLPGGRPDDWYPTLRPEPVRIATKEA